MTRALAQARAIVRRYGGGEVRVVNAVGKIEQSARVGRVRQRKRTS